MIQTLTRYSLPVLAVAVASLVAYFFLGQANPAFASAPSGLPATVATTSSLTIGPSVAYNVTLGAFLGTTTAAEGRINCAARVVSTTGNSAVMIAFASSASTTLSGLVGNTQAASTTVAYDSGLYGCGYWTFFAYSTTTITVTETR